MFDRELRDLAHVPRWGIARLISQQSVAEHSYFVTVYTMQLAELLKLTSEETFQIVTAAIVHDWEECFTGDIPGPAKRAIKDPDKYDGYVAQGIWNRFSIKIGETRPVLIDQVIKTADLIDEVLFLAGERQMGNQSIEMYFSTAKGRLARMWKELPWGSLMEGQKLWHTKIELAINKELTGHSMPPAES